jgi:hypothetical protein
VTGPSGLLKAMQGLVSTEAHAPSVQESLILLEYFDTSVKNSTRNKRHNR